MTDALFCSPSHPCGREVCDDCAGTPEDESDGWLLHAGNGNSASAPSDPDPSDELWDARDTLTRLRNFARARRCSPWAVLGCTLARLSTGIPHNVVLPALIGGHGSLNLFAANVGPSGAGKDAANTCAGDFLGGVDVKTTGPGSGEGLAHLFVEWRAKRGDEPAGQYTHTTAVLLVASEVDTLKALTARSGATLGPELRKAWSGHELGFAYATREKRLRVPEHTYRLGLVVGVQPERAGALLDDADAGTPQRFLWLPATDPDAPDERPEEPGGHAWHPPDWPPAIANRDCGRSVLEVCATAVHTIDQAHLDRTRGDGDALDGHALLCRLKVAALLAILDGHAEVGDEDWRLAGLIMRRSDRTRAGVVTALQLAQRTANVARAHAEADRGEVIEDRQVQRAGRTLLGYLQRVGNGVNGSDLRKRLAGNSRAAFEPAMDALVSSGQVERQEFQGQGRPGVRYRAVDR